MDQKLISKFQEDSFAKLLGIEIEKVEDGFAQVSMNVKSEMLNFHGTANGGAVFSLADVAFACASNSHGQTAVGITVNIHYMNAGFENERLIATATEDTKSSRLGLYRIEVKNEKEDLVALAEGMVYRKKEQVI
ncbi:hydroxyphenylacetyl-CoA thioesterase PaaI [Desertibacillus haloalkaliphilus]|uniref:hydroxyphenylacetyl-CoA thioesterase PaaI n=1 Tax=Desertibacillus haloalkaliphilus TaxID=1328930 RepID=UPI001C27A18C|nr:hydroxyphenylacetyl-CoA thioesterase PaaI [Desertibacillus haloalkaliphilus]MBU8906457.1 hydroxyphenylacetyl-CoA thioesterase PaaI [Desertibacillus haloalkaliphilus]